MSYVTLFLISFICIFLMDVINQITLIFGSPGWILTLLLLLNVCSVIGMLVISRKFGWKNKVPAFGMLSIKVYWSWSFLTILHGISGVNDYWDWKALMTSYLPSVLISLTLFIGINIEKCRYLFKFILSRVFLVSIFIIPFAMTYSEELYARSVMPICLFVLFLPYLPVRWRYFVSGIALTSIFMDMTYRSNVLRLLVPTVLVITYYFRFLINKKILNIALISLLGMPLILLTLGLSGIFNVFEENSLDYERTITLGGQVSESNIGADTRTLLYSEVIDSMLKKGSSFIYGEGGSAGYETNIFLIVNEKERYRAEVGFLNTLLYSGGVGVFAYGLILLVPAFYGVNRSNNYLAKMIGIFLAFRWLMFFLEDVAQFDMNFFTLWLMIGMCLSNRFRSMTDADLVSYFSWKNIKQSFN